MSATESGSTFGFLRMDRGPGYTLVEDDKAPGTIQVLVRDRRGDAASFKYMRHAGTVRQAETKGQWVYMAVGSIAVGGPFPSMHEAAKAMVEKDREARRDKNKGARRAHLAGEDVCPYCGAKGVTSVAHAHLEDKRLVLEMTCGACHEKWETVTRRLYIRRPGEVKAPKAPKPEAKKPEAKKPEAKKAVK